MRVKLPSVSKWGRIVPTDVAALNGIRLLLHGHYIMQITTMKEVKSGERQKGTDRWQMWFLPTPIRRINHIITEGLEHKRTYALQQPQWWFFSSLFTGGILQRFGHHLSSPLACLVGVQTRSTSSKVMAYESRFSSPLAPAAKLPATNNSWHTAARLLIDYLLFRKRKTGSRLAMPNDHNRAELEAFSDETAVFC